MSQFATSNKKTSHRCEAFVCGALALSMMQRFIQRVEKLLGVVLGDVIFHSGAGHQFGAGVHQFHGDGIFADGDGFLEEGESSACVFQSETEVICVVGDADAFDACMGDCLAVEAFLGHSFLLSVFANARQSARRHGVCQRLPIGVVCCRLKKQCISWLLGVIYESASPIDF